MVGERGDGRSSIGSWWIGYLDRGVKLLTHKQTLSHKCLGLSSYLSDSINRRC